MSFWLPPQNEFDSCSGYAQKCGQLAWSHVVSSIVWALHIAHCSRGKEAACRQRQSEDCLELQALSCRMENIFDSHFIQKVLKELSTSYGGLWVIGRNFWIAKSNKPEVIMEAYCKWTCRILLGYLPGLTLALSACLKGCLDSRFFSLLKQLAGAIQTHPYSPLHTLLTVWFLHCPCTNQASRKVCGNIPTPT